jgi:RNA polymerase primary sigma factor
MATVRNQDRTLLDLYFTDIAGSTPLSAAEECKLAQRIRRGDADARNTLVMANLRFVVRVASEFQGCGMALEDLISAGNLGLITAAERFDESHGVKFITYALWWIRQSILNSLSQDTRTVRLPANRIKLLNSITQLSRQIGQETCDEPDEVTIATALDVPVRNVREMMLWSRDIASLDAPFQSDEENLPMHIIPDETVEAPDCRVSSASDQRQLDLALASLEAREAEVLRQHFGLDDEEPRTLEAIGRDVGLTKERIRQIKEKALRKLRHPRHRAWLEPLREAIV